MNFFYFGWVDRILGMSTFERLNSNGIIGMGNKHWLVVVVISLFVACFPFFHFFVRGYIIIFHMFTYKIIGILAAIDRS